MLVKSGGPPASASRVPCGLRKVRRARLKTGCPPPQASAAAWPIALDLRGSEQKNLLSLIEWMAPPNLSDLLYATNMAFLKSKFS